MPNTANPLEERLGSDSYESAKAESERGMEELQRTGGMSAIGGVLTAAVSGYLACVAANDFSTAASLRAKVTDAQWQMTMRPGTFPEESVNAMLQHAMDSATMHTTGGYITGTMAAALAACALGFFLGAYQAIADKLIEQQHYNALFRS